MHVETLKLFSALVDGRNILNVQFLLKHSDFFGLKYDLLLAAAENTNLPKFYRRYVIDILRNVFVDCEPHIKVKFNNTMLVSTKNKPDAQCRTSSLMQNQFSEAADRFVTCPQLRPPASHGQLKRSLIKTLQSIGTFHTYDYDASLLLTSFSRL
jgi:hypothetical protein